MILWRLRGSSYEEIGHIGKEVVCSVEKHPGGYRLLVERAGEVMVDEAHGNDSGCLRKGGHVQR